MPLPRTKLCAAVLTAAAPALILVAAGSALADPTNPAGPRPLAGMGSDTTQEVLNGLSDVIVDGSGNKLLGSYDSLGGAITSTKATLPAGATTCAYTANDGATNVAGQRANGSGAGRARLLDTITPGNERLGCLDFARSSSFSGTAVPANTGGLTYVPFAIDAVTYAQRSDSTNSKTLSAATLKLIYQCDPSTTASFIPVLPNPSSGTRQFFLQAIGNPTLGACVVNGVTANGTPIQENDGTSLTDKKMVIPFSVAQYNRQSTGVGDLRGKAVLGAIGGITPQSINATAVTGVRKVYNIIPTSRIGSAPADATLNQVFVGPNALVCTTGRATIAAFGFAPSPECGETDEVAVGQ